MFGNQHVGFLDEQFLGQLTPAPPCSGVQKGSSPAPARLRPAVVLRKDAMDRGVLDCLLSFGLPGPRLLLTENHFNIPWQFNLLSSSLHSMQSFEPPGCLQKLMVEVF